MFSLIERIDGSFRIKINFLHISSLPYPELCRYLCVGEDVGSALEILERIKEKQDLDLELPPKRKKLK